MDHRSAWVFNALRTPHGACTSSGEDVAEACYRVLEDAERWLSSSQAARGRVVRMSLELRMVVSVG